MPDNAPLIRPYVPRNSRRILCVFPKGVPCFGTFHHAYPLMPGVRSVMPPLGLLTVAAYLPKEWDVQFVDENVVAARPADYQRADVIMFSSMHAQRREVLRLNEVAHGVGKLTVLGGPSVSACPQHGDGCRELDRNAGL